MYTFVKIINIKILRKEEINMGQNVTLKTIEEFIAEIDRAASEKSRTISDIKNSKLKRLICDGSAAAITSGAFGITAATLGLQSGATIGGTVIGSSAGGAGAASVAGGVVIKSIVSGGAAAATGAGTGATAGNTVLPVIGGIIGAGVGLSAGIIAGRASAKKQAAEKLRLYQELLVKQNIINMKIESEKNQYKSMYNKSVQDKERLKYLLGMLNINDEIKNTLAKEVA